MRRPVSWTEKTAEGKREIRVSVSADSVRWQVLEPGAEKWAYDVSASEEEWVLLEEKLTNLAQRGRCLSAELEAVRRRGKKKK